MIPLIDIGFNLLQHILSQHGTKLPAELVQAAQAAVDSWAKHRDDVVNTANLEAQRD